MNQKRSFVFLSLLLTSPLEAFQPPCPKRVQSTSLLAVGRQDEDVADDVRHPTRRQHLMIMMTGLVLFTTSPADAKYGDSTNMEMPNYIEYLIEKNEAGKNADAALYKGVDPTVLLKRLQEANKRLAEIPGLADQKKWTQIQGIITGPLGTLAVTINQIATADSPAKVKEASKKVKADVIAIGQAAAKKSGTGCVESSRVAARDLEEFVKLAFEL